MKNTSTAAVAAAEHVMGLLPPDRYREREAARRVDGQLDADLRVWETRFSTLAEALPPRPPSPSLLARIESRLDTLEREQQGTATFFATEHVWAPLHPGVLAKVLKFHGPDDPDSMLVLLEPGAVIPAHPHLRPEECVVLRGDMWVGPECLSAGDVHRVQAGQPHQPLSSRSGALLYIRYG